MKTITLQIGNSDDKLTQQGWAAFVEKTETSVNQLAKHIHFTGFSPPDAAWQNACWVFEIEAAQEVELKEDIQIIRKLFHQDSVEWTEGQTTFL